MSHTIAARIKKRSRKKKQRGRRKEIKSPERMRKYVNVKEIVRDGK